MLLNVLLQQQLFLFLLLWLLQLLLLAYCVFPGKHFTCSFLPPLQVEVTPEHEGATYVCEARNEALGASVNDAIRLTVRCKIEGKHLFKAYFRCMQRTMCSPPAPLSVRKGGRASKFWNSPSSSNLRNWPLTCERRPLVQQGEGGTTTSILVF